MAAHFKPKKCPECGSEKVIKDRVIGQHTGDWKCVDCRKVFSKFETEEWQGRQKDYASDKKLNFTPAGILLLGV